MTDWLIGWLTDWLGEYYDKLILIEDARNKGFSLITSIVNTWFCVGTYNKATGLNDTGGGHSYTRRWWGTSTLLTPFLKNIFRSYWVHFYAQLYLTDPLFLPKKSVFLSQLVPGIIWPKVGLFFHKNLLTLLKQFVPIFSLIFDLVDLLFHCY